MWLSYHEQAERSGARIVHSCGFDSIPYDLGVQFTVEQLPEDVPISVDGFVRTKASISGGTYQSTIEILSRLRSGSKVARERRRLEGDPAGRRVRGRLGQAAPGRVRRRLGRPVPDDRSRHRAPLGAGARALRTRFQLQPLRWSSGRCRCSSGWAPRPGMAVALAQIPPARDLLLKLKGAGEGPSEERRAKSWFSIRFAAHAGGRERPELRTEVSGGDPGYTRDIEDARRVRAVPRARRPPRARRAADPGGGDGACAAAAARGGRDRVQGARWLESELDGRRYPRPGTGGSRS